jgi:hypothetical protein
LAKGSDKPVSKDKDKDKLPRLPPPRQMNEAPTSKELRSIIQTGKPAPVDQVDQKKINRAIDMLGKVSDDLEAVFQLLKNTDIPSELYSQARRLSNDVDDLIEKIDE